MTTTGYMTMGRWPVFDGASCCAVGLALWECLGSLAVVGDR